MVTGRVIAKIPCLVYINGKGEHVAIAMDGTGIVARWKDIKDMVLFV